MTQKEFINTAIVVFATILLGMGIVTIMGLKVEAPAPVSFPQPQIEHIDPSKAAIGANIVVTGSNFASSKNSLHFGAGFAYINNLDSLDGRTIFFTLPETFDECGPDGICLGLLSQPLPGHTYEVTVVNAYGVSNSIPFTVEGSPGPSPGPSPAALACKKDSDCPSGQYICQAIQGTATSCPSDDPLCTGFYTIEKGECKLKEGNSCAYHADCISGFLCHNNICTYPIGRQCEGPEDATCSADFECVQGCGSPVSYEGEPPSPYFCQLKGYVRACPICLAGKTLINTPSGKVSARELKKGMAVWTTDQDGNHVQGTVIQVSKTPVPPTHRMVHLVLSDGRELLVSPGHPTANGKTVGELMVGESYEKAVIVSVARVMYDEGATYDILPSGETGFYWADGILLGSTLKNN